MQKIYETFFEGLSESVDERDLLRSLARLLEAFDVGRFAYLSFRSEGNRQLDLISNYPLDWTSFYLNQGYGGVDPVIAFARRTDEPFCWGDKFDCQAKTDAEVRLFGEAAEFGICRGLTIPVHDRRGSVAALTFAAEESRPVLLRSAKRYQRAFQLIATCFHIHARRTQADEQLVDGVHLTRREYECLQWAAKGKSAWETGQILGITRRTVAFHLDNTRHKLGVRTVAQAIARLASSNKLPG